MKSITRTKRTALMVIVSIAIVSLLMSAPGMRRTSAHVEPFKSKSSATKTAVPDVPARIITDPDLAAVADNWQLEEDAVNDVITYYGLTAADRDDVLRYARNEVRAMMYGRILDMTAKPFFNRDPREQQILNVLATRIKEYRIGAANRAILLYNDYAFNPCTFVAPTGYTYTAGPDCNRIGHPVLLGEPARSSITAAEFMQMGASFVYRTLRGASDTEIYTDVAFSVKNNIDYSNYVATTPNPLDAANWRPYLEKITTVGKFKRINQPTSNYGGPLSSFSGSGVGPVSTAVGQNLGVPDGFDIKNSLLVALGRAQNATIDLSGTTKKNSKDYELYDSFLLATVDADGKDTFYAATPPAPDDLKFILTQEGVSGTTESSTLTYKDASNICHTVRTSGRWFVDNNGTLETQKLTIPAPAINFQITFSDNPSSVSRKSGRFIHASRKLSTFGNLKLNLPPGGSTDLTIISFASPYGASERFEFQYRDCDGNKRTAKLKLPTISLLGNGVARASCFASGDFGVSRVIASINGTTDAPSALTLRVNGGTSATANGLTVSNLAVNNQYQVTAFITRADVPPGTEAVFTLKVTDTFLQETTIDFRVKYGGVDDTFVEIPTSVNVGTAYTATVATGDSGVECASASYSVSSGSLPNGLTLVTEYQGTLFPTSTAKIIGTPTSGGAYDFTITKTGLNGESISRSYAIFVQSAVANLSDSVISWWRGEEGTDDDLVRSDGAMVGNLTFAEGKVNDAFQFDGSNAYVALPDDTFSPSLDFTFELWFQTKDKGVILGQQRFGVTPYQTPQFGGVTPAIYVDQNGRLRVQMFVNENNQFTTSPNRVDDGAFHHVAVTYRRDNAGSGTRTTYLDGVNIGSVNLGQFANPAKYQLGTGYVNDGFVGGMTGWFNFKGLIDEVTLYNRTLTDAEISDIFAAGSAGKMSVRFLILPLSSFGASDGGIQVVARGGTTPLKYDFGNGFVDANTALNLSAGNYNVTIKDLEGRTVTRAATIVNPPPNLSLTTTQANPTCNGQQGGRITIFATGLTGPAEYSVLNGANVQSSPIFTELGAGTYTPWIHDLNSNTFFTGDPVTLTQPSAVSVTPSNFVNAALNVPYSRTFTLSGGSPPFTLTAQGTDVNNGFALPDGLFATADGTSITISGTPQQVGTFPILIFIRDKNGCQSSTRNFPLTITATATFGISGRVTNGGQGLANVTVSYAGASSGSTVTDASGNYAFNNLAGSGNYTLTASLSGYTFAQPTLTYNNLSANFTDANFVTAVTTYEGDIANRAGGDGSVNVQDLVALGRMRNNLDPQPTSSAEFQRTDIAPRASLGNGVIDDNDLTQLRSYILASNPRTPAGGPISTGAAPAQFERSASSVASSATISAGSVRVLGSSAVVPITLSSNGNVSALQFTIAYDRAKLNGCTLTGSLPPGTTIIPIEDTVSGGGRIRVVAYKQFDGTSVFPSGDQQLMQFSCTPKTGATGVALINFSDAPTQRSASDPQANAITLNSMTGAVTISTDYGIAGRITDGRQGLPNVMVRRTAGAQQATTATDAEGNYSFTGLTSGTTYTITPSLNGYAFTPASRDVLVNDAAPFALNKDFAAATIVNPSFSIDDVSQTEGNAGTSNFTFTVTKTGAGAASVNFQTQDGSATTASGDYASNSGTLNFASADTAMQVNVTVNGDTMPEPDETFSIVLSNPVGASLTDNTGLGTIRNDDAPVSAGQLIISEFRLSGPNPNSAQNEFIEIYNNTNSSHTVGATDASAGYGVAASDGVLRCTIPNGTIIPARGHFLCVNSVGYSLGNYPAGNAPATAEASADMDAPILKGVPQVSSSSSELSNDEIGPPSVPTATGDATYTTDIPDNTGIALFSSTTTFTMATRLDAVGSTSEANPLYKEGAGYPALTPFMVDYSLYRDTCGKGGSTTASGPCTTLGLPKDTDNNAADFVFVDTTGTNAGAGQRLGAPGPENLSSPIQRNSSFGFFNLDTSVGASSSPNRVRSFTSDPPNNSTFGTLELRKRVVNNTGAAVTRLRFRIVDMTTFPVPSGFADLRLRSSVNVAISGIKDATVCSPNPTPCMANVQGTTLETPPAQASSGGFNSTLSAGTVTLGAPLANGASINLRFLLGLQSTGKFRFFINIEALP